jgi:hypothetical protein
VLTVRIQHLSLNATFTHYQSESDSGLYRKLVRGVMHDLDPTGFTRCFPGKQPKKVRRTPADMIGVYFEFHSDEHEKTNFKALRLGPASIDVHGSRCHGSRFDLQSQAIPNARCIITVAHMYLDLVEVYGGKYTL